MGSSRLSKYSSPGRQLSDCLTVDRQTQPEKSEVHQKRLMRLTSARRTDTVGLYGGTAQI